MYKVASPFVFLVFGAVCGFGWFFVGSSLSFFGSSLLQEIRSNVLRDDLCILHTRRLHPRKNIPNWLVTPDKSDSDAGRLLQPSVLHSGEGAGERF